MDEDGPNWGYFPGTLDGNSSCVPNTTYAPGTRHYVYNVYANKLWYGMLLVGLTVLALYALLSGVILAVCGPEMTWLQLRSITGTHDERKRARIVARMRRHSSWMLCSLVICTVACAEILPIIIQGLWAEPAHAQWVPILVSTLVIALCAEILPQYFIPRNPIEWAYFFWPVIYSCMCLTGIISWPLGWILDNFGGKNDENGIFTNGELRSLIRYHERSENNGGMLGYDAARVMAGALLLDSRQIGGEICSMLEIDCNPEKDIEMANVVISSGMITQWSLVKTVDIDEVVDASFLSKVKSWSYSRIPVVGNCIVDEQNSRNSSWEGREIFGFLHIKSLVGLKIGDSMSMLVKDLPIYPLPIIQEDMPAYQVLNIFQLGMARMAVVVPKPLKDGQVLTLSANNFDIINKFQSPCWAPIEQSTSRLIKGTDNVNLGEGTNWAADVLEAANPKAKSSAKQGKENSVQTGPTTNASTKNNLQKPSKKVVGIRCPKPVGIVTFENIVGVILQNPRRVSIDFYNGDIMKKTIKPLPSAKKYCPAPMGAARMGKPALNDPQRVEAVPLYIRNDSIKANPRNQQLRKRNISNRGKPTRAMDGADDESFELTSHMPRALESNTSRGSSYTQNSRGGFHSSVSSRMFKSVPIGLDGADEHMLDNVYNCTSLATRLGNDGSERNESRYKTSAITYENAASKNSVIDSNGLTQTPLTKSNEGQGGKDAIKRTPRSCSLPARGAFALPPSRGPRVPWNRRYVSVAAPEVVELKREVHPSLETTSTVETPLKYKLNPAAPVFRFNSPTDHEYLSNPITTDSEASYSFNLVDGLGISSSAPSISSSFNRRASWLYDSSKVYSEPQKDEESQICYWDAAKEHSGFPANFADTEPYNGDPNSCLFDGPARTPAPSEGIPTELLTNMAGSKYRNAHYKSATLSCIRRKAFIEESSAREGTLDDATGIQLWPEGTIYNVPSYQEISLSQSLSSYLLRNITDLHNFAGNRAELDNTLITASQGTTRRSSF